jgi:beta-phosphoglucomutase
MLRAIIFDFNGILVDDEPIHLEMFQRVLREEGISLSQKDYYEHYLGMDDRSCFKAAYAENGRSLDEGTQTQLVRRKAAYYQQALQKGLAVFPGVENLIVPLAASYPLAIASGALRNEIEEILQTIGLGKYFQVIVSAEDVSDGKPNPEIFLKALTLLNQLKLRSRLISPAECLVIEDSKEGILGAHRAGMKCLAVTNSHAAPLLAEADAVVPSLNGVTIAFLEKLVR